MASFEGQFDFSPIWAPGGGIASAPIYLRFFIDGAAFPRVWWRHYQGNVIPGPGSIITIPGIRGTFVVGDVEQKREDIYQVVDIQVKER